MVLRISREKKISRTFQRMVYRKFLSSLIFRWALPIKFMINNFFLEFSHLVISRQRFLVIKVTISSFCTFLLKIEIKRDFRFSTPILSGTVPRKTAKSIKFSEGSVTCTFSNFFGREKLGREMQRAMQFNSSIWLGEP